MAELVPLTLSKVMQSKSYTVIILGTEEKRFAIYTDPHVGINLQTYLTGENKPRPLTFDLVGSMFKGLNIKPLQIVINDVEDTIYFARLFLEQQAPEVTQILEIDARPSDALTLALIHNIPIFCKKDIFEKAVSVQE